MNQHIFTYRDETTTWQETASGWALISLCGMPCPGEAGALEQGLFSLATLAGAFETAAYQPERAEFSPEGAIFAWTLPAAGLALERRWEFDAASGVWSRTDTLQNTSAEPVTLTRALARFALSGEGHRLYSQGSQWCCENQGQWVTLPHGTLTLRCPPGRTTLGANPFLGVAASGAQGGVAFHIIPTGNWTIRATVVPAVPLLVELGLATEDLRLELAPGERLELPRLLLHGLPEGQEHLAAPRLHRYLLARELPPPRMTTPVVFNTWFDRWDRLEVDHLRAQLAAVKDLGCEVFTIDAGWYGATEDIWSLQVGDWREKQASAFRGKMADFAEEVRAAGLGFGIWMEPERVSPRAPIAQEHPEWLIPVGDWFRYDLENPAAYAYLRGEMFRLVEQYDLAWMKIDFNFELGTDPTGAELDRYFGAWYRLLDELRARFPHTFFEGCASGGMRLDLRAQGHFDGHFLSDSVNPVDDLRLTEGGWLRLAPGRIGKWVVLRAPNAGLPGYADASLGLHMLTPRGALWDEAELVTVDFACRVALAGQFGVSGDPSSLPPAARERLRFHIEFFKTWRDFLIGTVGHLLTPPRLIEERGGWSALQMQDPATGDSLVFAYRLARSEARATFRLRDLDPTREYRITDPDAPGQVETRTGEALLREGLTIALPGIHQAAIRIVVSSGG